MNTIIKSLQDINDRISSKRVVMYTLLLLFVADVIGNQFFGYTLEAGLQIQLCSLLGGSIVLVFGEQAKEWIKMSKINNQKQE